ncbi:MAG: translocation/assembly module TamB [Myxococcales bacterium]|nr:translocation/assembly module TamB [Myxococcales bacterium]
MALGRRPIDFGRLVARLLCALFALIGAVPLALAVAIRSEPVLAWASSETARVLQEELGVTASYRVEMKLLPLTVALHDIVVPSSDGGAPFLLAESVAVHPRFFSLLAGRLDVGDVEIQRPRSRVVLKDGKLVNLAYRLPEQKTPSKKLERAPFSSLGITEAEIDFEVDGVKVKTGPIDMDVFADKGPVFEVGLRAAETSIVTPRLVTLKTGGAPLNRRGEIDGASDREFTYTAFDEDAICRLDVRVRIEGSTILVRRLALSGVADQDPGEHTLPKCLAEDDKNAARVALGLSQLRLELRPGETPLVDGHVVVRGPVSLANRYAKMAQLSGWAAFAGDVHFTKTGKLPDVRGRLRGGDFQLADYRLAKKLDATVEIRDDKIDVPRLETHFADGVVVVSDTHIEPLEKGAPISSGRVEGSSVSFSALMRDLGVTPNTIVAWDLDKTRATHIKGTLSPLHIDADLYAETKNFEIYNRAFHDPARKHMIGVRAATIRGRLGVRAGALEFYDTRATFGKSTIVSPLVSIGFHNDMQVEVSKGSKIELSDVSPLVDIPWAGAAELTVKMAGKSGDPLLTGDLAINKFEFGGFPVGDIKSAKLRFRPLKVDLFDIRGRKNKSEFVIPTARLDFDSGSTVIADATLQAERLDVRDFLAMFLFDQDPRFDPIHGTGKIDARVHYDLGGHKDRCGGGVLNVLGRMDMKKLDLFEERYDSGRADFEFRWLDREASYLGIELDVPSITLSKGTGTVLGSLTMRQGGVVRGNMVGTAVPLSKIDALGMLGSLVDARGSGVAEVDGTVDELAFSSHVRVSPMRTGTKTLPASELSVRLEPKKRPLKVIGRSRCGGQVTAPFDRAEWESDPTVGTFHVDGKMFGGQIGFKDLRVTRQRSKNAKGSVTFSDLDLAALAELSPAAAGSKTTGKLSGKLQIDDLMLDRPSSARGSFAVERMTIARAGVSAEVLPGAKDITLADGKLGIGGLALAIRTPTGQESVFDLRGDVSDIAKSAMVDASLTLRPMDLSKLSGAFPRVQSVKGRLSGGLQVSGPASALRYQGGFDLEGGELQLRGFSPITDLKFSIAVDNDELRLARASARVGNGSLRIEGSAPLKGFSLGAVRGVITARDIALPLAEGVKGSVDADLVATWEAEVDGERKLPGVTGNVLLKSFEYTRPVVMTADIASLAQRGKRTVFEAYDPADDFLEFEVTLKSDRNLKLRNNLIEAELALDPDGLTLAGTNQRFGLRGEVKLKQGGTIKLRRNEFEIRQGVVRFDDLTRIAPQVDVTAVTEYRRYSESSSAEKGGTATPTSGSGQGGTTAQGGRWRISMRAHGDADKLNIDLTSDPALAQDDIFLLLTVGLTRAELDQAQSASVGESVALEALGTLSGADRAVTEAVPLIDEFRFGSAYSSRTGRTEPTVTIGKRLAERIRANVTSGLAESREIRSNLEWRLNNRVSLEGSYDNVNDISSSSLGNLGADIRWRLEFE